MERISDFPSFIKAKGLSTAIPMIAGSKRVLVPFMDFMREHTKKRMEKVHPGTPESLEKKLMCFDMLCEMVKRNLPRFSTATKRRLAENLFYNVMYKATATHLKYREKYGEWPPFLLVISPTMRCNLRCFGCYAGDYDKSQELTREEVSNIITQAKQDLGIHFITISGGEPTTWPHLLDVAEEHHDVFYQVYTHGMLIDDKMASRIAELGNVYPAISVEGSPEETERRRGPGAWEKIDRSMRLLRDKGVLFGFSATHTRRNHDALGSDAFVDRMVDAGACYGWYFQYMLTGREPQPELVPTPEQRLERYEAIIRFRTTKPILIYDFWNDGEATEGCIAWGKKYLHITPSGWVEPCVFVHFAKDNIRDKRLVDIVNSPCFKDARSMQPFNSDYRLPCPIIDNPDVLPYLCKKHGLMPTHPGSESIITTYQPVIQQNAVCYHQRLAEWDGKQQKAAVS